VFQGIAPTVVGGFPDRTGRRPAYILCFTLFVVFKVGLALQSNYITLLVLCCVQSYDSSGTSVLSSAVVSDIATRQQRGSYIGIAALGSPMGPALGPLGEDYWTTLRLEVDLLVSGNLRWRNAAGLRLRNAETCRNVIGNGSHKAQRWNLPLFSYLRRKKYPSPAVEADSSKRFSKKRPGLLATIPLIFEKESFLLLFYGSLVYAGSYMISVGLPQQLSSTYQFESIHLGI
jgi:MFS family permease